MEHDGKYTGEGKLSIWFKALNVKSLELISVEAKVNKDYEVGWIFERIGEVFISANPVLP